MKKKKNTVRSVMLGHAVADALGVPVEFKPRWVLSADPVTDMQGYGSHPVPAGCWSDDTSMSLATLDSLALGGIDYDDIMEKFALWRDEDAYTATGVTFDIGGATSRAISNFREQGSSENAGLTSEGSNGNGSLMRIHPFVLCEYLGNKAEPNLDMIHRASALTHAHAISKMGCGVYALVLWELLKEKSKDAVKRGLQRARAVYAEHPAFSHYERLLTGDISALPLSAIKSTGYVVDTLEAAVYCLLTTEDYAACVLKAVNLGEDTDTVGAVAGGLAGALYGLEGIPAHWLDALLRRAYIEELCDKMTDAWAKEG